MRDSELIGFLASALAAIWGVAFTIGVLLPDGWVMRWYGFPTAVTMALFIPFVACIGGVFGGRLASWVQSRRPDSGGDK